MKFLFIYNARPRHLIAERLVNVWSCLIYSRHFQPTPRLPLQFPLSPRSSSGGNETHDMPLTVPVTTNKDHLMEQIESYPA